MRIQELQLSLSDSREQILQHELYSSLKNADQMRQFMEHHIFAVWDFMSLVKTLQLQLTGVQVPWVPKANSKAVRLINEIVLGEESDEHPLGGHVSHFDLYRQAMRQVGASTQAIDLLISNVKKGESIEQAAAHLPSFIQQFLNTTFDFIRNAKTHEIASIFTFGREDLVPAMFYRIVDTIANENAGDFSLFKIYLERHIHLDQSEHGPMAMSLVTALCLDDERKWAESREAALKALAQRKKLWDGILILNKTSPIASHTISRSRRSSANGTLADFSRPNC